MHGQIDRMEAEEAAERRRLQVEAANRMLFSDNDRVRALHSRLLLSEVLVERQRQMAHAAGIRALEAASEQDWLQRQAAALKVSLFTPSIVHICLSEARPAVIILRLYLMS